GELVVGGESVALVQSWLDVALTDSVARIFSSVVLPAGDVERGQIENRDVRDVAVGHALVCAVRDDEQPDDAGVIGRRRGVARVPPNAVVARVLARLTVGLRVRTGCGVDLGGLTVLRAQRDAVADRL